MPRCNAVSNPQQPEQPSSLLPSSSPNPAKLLPCSAYAISSRPRRRVTLRRSQKPNRRRAQLTPYSPSLFLFCCKEKQKN
ncbi:hypothetical protein M0R45_015621 [Rubus argutus]|uniref:Uncharacterized protein n=1 Tax=Rubus argutus TaxID=59490 RepID=A0AAW1XSK9_RUBAR